MGKLRSFAQGRTPRYTVDFGASVKRDLHYYGDPILRERFVPVTTVTDDLRRLAEDMIETMRLSEGVGLAAQQIGERRAICVVEVPADMDTNDKGERLHPDLVMPMVLINPVISEPSKKSTSREEGCLSFPELRGNIDRAQEIRVQFMDLDGKQHDIRVRDFLARVIQHEVDHLNGVLFIDRMSPAKRFAISGKLKRMKQATEEKMGSNR